MSHVRLQVAVKYYVIRKKQKQETERSIIKINT